MPKIFLALGSNIDPEKNIAKTIEFLEEKIHAIKRAPLYRTKDFGGTQQPEFMNTAVSGNTDLSPRDLLMFVKGIEQRLGRQDRGHWGPREIDIDIALYDNLIVNEPDLQIPHASLHQRDVVLQPLVDLDPSLMHPILKTSLAELLKKIPPEDRCILRTLEA